MELSSFYGIKALTNNLIGSYIGVSVFGRQKITFSNFKISYIHRVTKTCSTTNLKSSNITSAINLIVSNLCFSINISETIAIFGKILQSNCLPEFASKIIGDHVNVDRSIIERYFIDDIYNLVRPELDLAGKIGEFIEAFYSFSQAGQNYVVHKFIGRPVLEIEDSITKTKIFLKDTPMQGLVLGNNLFTTTNENLITVRNILSYTNYQYRLLANILADTLLDCGIIYFNALQKSREVLLSEGSQILELMNHANTIAIGGDVRKRVDENFEFFETWISNARRNELEKFKFEQERQKTENEKHKRELEISSQEEDRQRQERERQYQATNAKRQRGINDRIHPLKILKNIVEVIKISFLTIFGIMYRYVLFAAVVFGIIYLIDNLGNESSNDSKITSKWKGNSLENGTSPYTSIFGEGIYDYRSKCWLKFKNGNSTDAIACLVNYYSGTTIRNSYIRAGTNCTMSNLPEGIYKVKVFYGKDWNPEKTFKNGSIKGGFENDVNYSLSDNPSDLIHINITVTTQRISYTTGEITLYTVKNGNMNQRNINSDEFFK